MEISGFLQSGFMPLPPSFLEGMEDTDRFLLAFPRSGSRWLRIALEDMTWQAPGEAKADYYEKCLLRERCANVLPASPAETQLILIPDAHRHPRETSLLLAQKKMPIFRSHHLTQVLQKSSGRVLYVFRAISPMLYSYYHHAKSGGFIPEDLSLEVFCEGRIELWKDHVKTMLEARADEVERVLFVEYLDDGPFTADQLNACARHYDLAVPDSAASGAVERLKSFFTQLNESVSTPHTRGNNQMNSSMTVALREQLEAATKEIFQAAQEAAAIDGGAGGRST